MDYSNLFTILPPKITNKYFYPENIETFYNLKCVCVQWNRFFSFDKIS